MISQIEADNGRKLICYLSEYNQYKLGNRHILIYYFEPMSEDSTHQEKQYSNSLLREQILKLMAHTYLKGRIFIDLRTSEYAFNCCQELFINISLLNNQQIPPKSYHINLKVILPFEDVEDEPTFILFNCNEQTYRQMQITPTCELSPLSSLVEPICQIVKNIDNGRLDISFLDLSKKKVNLQGQLRNPNQGLNISTNSCFRYRQKANKTEKRYKQGHTPKQYGYEGIGIISNFKNTPKKRNTQPMKKNANLPKFLIRIFIKYVDKFKRIYPKREFERLNNQCKKMKEWKKSENKQQALGLKHLKMLFQEFKEGFPDPRFNRKIVIEIISKYLLEQICQNSQIPQTHRLGYLVACRVYALRCRNSTLAGRIQSK